MSDEAFMRLAIEKCREGIAAGQSPFGTVIILGDRVVTAAHNTVLRDCDPTAHAEVNGIRAAAGALGTIRLAGSTLYTTCEPCPMCMAAIHWAKIDRVVYGATIADATAAGFSELAVPAEELARLGRSPLRVEVGPLRDECRALFALWKETGLARPY
jgi:tRNA(Arg) A34 adenosine deaminase TadA